MTLPIYLDYAATTPVDPRVADKISQCLTLDGIFANPASRSHLYGWQAEEEVEEARELVANLIGADTREIVWTSGATEADNLAIKGAAFAYRDKGNHLITSTIEHKAVLDCFKYLEAQGFRVTWLSPDSQGCISSTAVESAIEQDTVLVSLMHVNNETGSQNDIAAIGQICHDREVVFHVDAAQSVGKLPINVYDMNIDLLSMSAHKFYGPKGIGALFVRRQPLIKVAAQIHGGGHERGMRSGTLPTHQIAGMGMAAKLAGDSLESEHLRIKGLRTQFLDGLSQIEGLKINGDQTHGWPGIINLTFSGLDGETLLLGLNQIAISTGSACTSASVEPSFVLTHMGVSRADAYSALRISIGRFTTESQIQQAVEHIVSVVEGLQRQP